MKLICITCPKGCEIKYDLVAGKAINIEGNSCPRGKAYCESEVTNPTRMITSTIPITNAIYHQLPVITSSPIPKQSIFKVMGEIKKCQVTAPIEVGQVLIKNAANTQVDIIASRTMKKI